MKENEENEKERVVENNNVFSKEVPVQEGKEGRKEDSMGRRVHP